MNRTDPSVHALAGIAGGIIAFGLTYPLITISTRLQVNKQQSTTVEIIRETLKEEGWQGLFSGLSSGLVGITATSGVYYYSYETLRIYLEGSKKNKISDMKMLAMGGVSGIITALITNPIWVINVRKTTFNKNMNDEPPMGILKTGKLIVEREGWRSLWNGIIPALILAANPTIQYAAFEKLKTLYAKNGRSPTMLQAFWMAAIAKILATVVTYPYIVVKSRLQNVRKGTDQQGSTNLVLRHLFQTEGLKGFYKGIESKIVQSVLNAAFLFMFKEKMVSVVIITSRLIQMAVTRSKVDKLNAATTIASEVLRK